MRRSRRADARVRRRTGTTGRLGRDARTIERLTSTTFSRRLFRCAHRTKILDGSVWYVRSRACVSRASRIANERMVSPRPLSLNRLSDSESFFVFSFAFDAGNYKAAKANSSVKMI